MVVLALLCGLFFLAGCTGQNNAGRYDLTRHNLARLLQNPLAAKSTLVPGSYTGCEHIPTPDPTSSYSGIEITGAPCEVSVKEDGRVSVNFLPEEVLVVFLAGSDTHLGEFQNDGVLVVQHDRNDTPMNVTHTRYDSSGAIIYGQSGQGDFIRACADLRDVPQTCRKAKFYP